MCGIAGYHGKADPLAEERVRLMTAALSHRGPDGDGFFSAPGVVLGHRRLKILDLTNAARQPIFDESGCVAVSFNGEIYNYRELRSELEARGHRFASSGDSAVIPAAYLEWGLDFARRLHGMFALALYDRRDGRLVLARDRVGIKPLYFTRTSDGVAFASEMRAIVAGGWIERAANSTALRQFLRLGYRTGSATAYAGVEELPPGSMLVADSHGALELRAYWHPPAIEDYEPAEIVARVREIFERSLDRHLQSDVPVGAHLSGGLDSSTVVSLMARRSSEPVDTFSVYFTEDAWFDERRYSTAVSESAGARQHFVSPTSRQVQDAMDTIVAALDEPVGGPGAIPQYFLNEKIRESGVVVVLGGQGADELFAGYERYRIPHAASALRAHLFGEAYADVRSAGMRTAVIDGVKRLLHLDPARMLVSDQDGVADAWGFDLQRQMAHEFRWYLPMLLHVEDRTSMAWSIESRVPFIDDELIEFVLALDATKKIRGGTLKWILRDATRGIVPDLVLNRKDKRGLPTPIGAWMRGPMRTFALERLTDRVLLDSGLVDPKGLKRLIDVHMSGLRDFAFLLWRPLVVAMWLAQPRAPRFTPELAVAG